MNSSSNQNQTSRSRGRAPALLIAALLVVGGAALVRADLAANKLKTPKLAPPGSTAYGYTLAEWLSIYWRWNFSGADPSQSTVGSVQLLPIPSADLISGSGTPDDPALYRGHLEMTLPPGTPFVLPAFAWNGERYNNGTPDDQPLADEALLAGVHPALTIDGVTVLSDANKAAYYVPATYFDPPVTYPEPTSYGSIASVLSARLCSQVCMSFTSTNRSSLTPARSRATLTPALVSSMRTPGPSP
jgi:hypothetical protein